MSAGPSGSGRALASAALSSHVYTQRHGPDPAGTDFARHEGEAAGPVSVWTASRPLGHRSERRPFSPSSAEPPYPWGSPPDALRPVALCLCSPVFTMSLDDVFHHSVQ